MEGAPPASRAARGRLRGENRRIGTECGDLQPRRRRHRPASWQQPGTQRAAGRSYPRRTRVAQPTVAARPWPAWQWARTVPPARTASMIQPARSSSSSRSGASRSTIGAWRTTTGCGHCSLPPAASARRSTTNPTPASTRARRWPRPGALPISRPGRSSSASDGRFRETSQPVSSAEMTNGGCGALRSPRRGSGVRPAPTRRSRGDGGRRRARSRRGPARPHRRLRRSPRRDATCSPQSPSPRRWPERGPGNRRRWRGR